MMMKRALLVPVLLLLGCTSDHYMIVGPETPLYVTPDGDRVMARIPRFHHEPLPDGVVRANGRLRLVYKGKIGFAEQERVRVFSYLNPGLDGGVDRDEVVSRELREAMLASVGKSWPAHIRAAIRRKQVLRGMTRRMVEVAWGWPLTVKPGPAKGEQLWVYREEKVEVRHELVQDLWWNMYSPHPFGYWRTHAGPHWSTHGYGYMEVRIPVIEERIVTMSAKGRVEKVVVRRFLKT